MNTRPDEYNDKSKMPPERLKELLTHRAWQPAFATDGDMGVTMRDYFAAAALQGMLANADLLLPNSQDNVNAFCELSFLLADAMLQEKYK